MFPAPFAIAQEETDGRPYRRLRRHDDTTTSKALDGPSKFRGKVIKSSFSKEAEAEIQKELHGE